MVQVRSVIKKPLIEFLEEHDYLVETVEERVLSICLVGGPVIYLVEEIPPAGEDSVFSSCVYFELNLGKLGSLRENTEVLYKFLDLNSEIAPISIAINQEGPEPQLVLVERIQGSGLDSNEILSVLESLEMACLRVQSLMD